MLGRMWRLSRRKNPVPLATAASTKGRSRSVRTTPRTSRVTRGTSATVMAKTTLPRLALVSAMSAIASSTEGIAMSPSITRMTMASATRLSPVTSPMARPTDRAQEGDAEADDERDARAEDRAAVEIASQHVGAEPVLLRGWLRRRIGDNAWGSTVPR